MSDRLNEALAEHDYGTHNPKAIHDSVIPAARLVAEAREPDYEAGALAQFQTVDEVQLGWVKRIVNAALGIEPGRKIRVVVVDDE